MNGFIELRYAKRFGFWGVGVVYVGPRGLHACPCVTMVVQPVCCAKASCGVVSCIGGQLSPQFALSLVLL